MLDMIARRYSCRPSEVLAASPWDLTVDRMCAVEGKKQQDSILRRIQSGKEMVIPVVVVGELGS